MVLQNKGLITGIHQKSPQKTWNPPGVKEVATSPINREKSLPLITDQYRTSVFIHWKWTVFCCHGWNDNYNLVQLLPLINSQTLVSTVYHLFNCYFYYTYYLNFELYFNTLRKKDTKKYILHHLIEDVPCQPCLRNNCTLLCCLIQTMI